jgi:hypothetical protein
MYTQCLIQRDDQKKEVVWIPDEFAVKEKYLRISPRQGRKETAFFATVKRVFSKTDRDVSMHENDWEKNKRRTDI